ncbi:MAG TPA: hypothetical protein VMU20_10240 [Candidatus Dormibacteraeota bacterium]|jgi:hypothetical protein|nr:hypothetical protein [Candidatus Dormibacteraeota bacterium]
MTGDPTDATPDDTTDDAAQHGDEPADDSFLMGATGVQAEVEAELARAEAELEGDAPASDDSDAVV